MNPYQPSVTATPPQAWSVPFAAPATAGPPPAVVVTTPGAPPAGASADEVAALRAELAALREELKNRPVPQATASQQGGAPYPGTYAWHLADGRVLTGQPSPLCTHYHDAGTGDVVQVIGIHAENPALAG